MARLVLASGSPRRADVLRQLGLDPLVSAAHVDESYLPGETPREHVERLARTKAEAVARTMPDALVVGGDTVVVDGERVLFKPTDPGAAIEMLESLSGRTHSVLTGIALVGSHGTVSTVSGTRVHMRPYGVDAAARYVETGEPLDKAGAYGIQGLGAALVDGIGGDYYSVVGFPVGAFLDLLGQAGWSYDFGKLTRLPG